MSHWLFVLLIISLIIIRIIIRNKREKEMNNFYSKGGLFQLVKLQEKKEFLNDCDTYLMNYYSSKIWNLNKVEKKQIKELKNIYLKWEISEEIYISNIIEIICYDESNMYGWGMSDTLDMLRHYKNGWK